MGVLELLNNDGGFHSVRFMGVKLYLVGVILTDLGGNKGVPHNRYLEFLRALCEYVGAGYINFGIVFVSKLNQLNIKKFWQLFCRGGGGGIIVIFFTHFVGGFLSHIININVQASVNNDWIIIITSEVIFRHHHYLNVIYHKHFR